MEGLGSMKIEQYRCLSFDQTANVQRDHVGSSTGTSNRDCGAIDPCSPFYRSYLRAVRFLAEQCENFFCDPTYGLEKFIKDIMVGKIAPNQDGFVMLAPVNDRSSRPPGVWLDEKPARLIREVQRDFDLKNDAKYFGQFTTACGRTLDQVRNQFFVDCYAECVQPPGSRMKANTTECVPVPSSEHVAEIVGKKGGKIKNIRAETNTYIKTPKRDEEPVFVITGRKEDVGLAKQKILAAAEHFTQLREARRQNPGGPVPVVGPPKRDGDVTVSVEVPYEFVGLVVGQKGATIKRIQQDTNTYITTPSRRHRPIFEVVGQPLEVERAREAIRAHIDSRVEKFRAEGMAAATAAGSGPGSCSSLGGFGLGGGGGGYPTTSPPSMSPFLGYDDAVFGGSGGMGVSSSGSLQQPRRQTPPSAADISLFSAPFGNSGGGSGVSWSSGAAGMCSSLRAPPPVTGHQLPPPQHPPPPSCNAGRLSAFRQLPLESCSSGAGVTDSLSALNAGLRQLSFSSAADSMAVSSTAGGMANSCWLPERSSCSLPPCSVAGGDPADPPVMSRRLSDDEQQQRDIGSVLFNFPGHLGWSSAGASTTATAPLASLDQQQQYLQHQLQQQQHQVQQTASISSIIGSINKGSSETLNSDSGVELTTPPPMLDGAAFGPIGSKRTSPASVGSD